jgi:hypothetical protein
MRGATDLVRLVGLAGTGRSSIVVALGIAALEAGTGGYWTLDPSRVW